MPMAGLQRVCAACRLHLWLGEPDFSRCLLVLCHTGSRRVRPARSSASSMQGLAMQRLSAVQCARQEAELAAA